MGDSWQSEPTDFPPTVITVEITQAQTEGPLVLPWATQMQLSSLWRTAEQMSLNAEQIAAEFRGARPGRAALFALAAEVLAVGSVGMALLPLLGAFFPNVALRALFNPGFAFALIAWGIALVLLMAGLMVGLHWFWAWGMELGAWNKGLPRNWQSGVALASYSCGWDLVTSPFGVFALLISKGPRSVAPGLQAALRAPRLCVSAYLQSTRGLSPAEQKAVLTFAVWVTAPVVLLLAGALLVGLVAILA